MGIELHSNHSCCIGTNLPQSMLWLVSVMNKCILHEQFVHKQIVVFIITKRIIIYIALKLNI